MALQIGGKRWTIQQLMWDNWIGCCKNNESRSPISLHTLGYAPNGLNI